MTYKFYLQSILSLCIFYLMGTSKILGAPIGKNKISYEDSEIVGAIFHDDEPICTAFAISHYQIVTAKHCLRDDSPLDNYSFYFSKQIFTLDSIAEDDINSDIVIINLSSRVDKYLTLSSELPQHNLSSQLYGFDIETEKTFVSKKANFKKIYISRGKSLKGIYLHTHSTKSATSGSPIIQDGRVVAVHLGYISNPSCNQEKYNVAIAAAAIGQSAEASSIDSFQPEGRNGKASFSAIVKGVSEVVDSTAKAYLNRLAENAADAHSMKNSTGREPEPKPIGSLAKKQYARKFYIKANTMTRIAHQTNRIIKITSVSGSWRCCSDTPWTSYQGYIRGNPHGDEDQFKKNDAFPYMCLLCDEASSLGTPVVAGMDVIGNKTQVILWANDVMGGGQGSLEVCVLFECEQ